MIELVIYFCATVSSPLADCGRHPIPGAVYETYDECERMAIDLNEGKEESGGVPVKDLKGTLLACEPKAN